jgi:hypothetical protein
MLNPYEVRLETGLEAAITASLAAIETKAGDPTWRALLSNQVLIMAYLLWMRGAREVVIPDAPKPSTT